MQTVKQTLTRRHIAPWAAAAALALTPLFVPMAAHAQNGFKVVASGLNNPHGLTFGSDGSLYIAEAGIGGDGASLKSGDGSIVSYGATGAVTRLLGDTQTRILTGLPSLGDQTTKPFPGAGATGLQDLAFGKDGSLYGVIGISADGKTLSTLGVFPARPNPLPGPPFYQSVPTSIAVGPDGALYVGELTGFPYPGGAAEVFRLDPKTGVSTAVRSGD